MLPISSFHYLLKTIILRRDMGILVNILFTQQATTLGIFFPRAFTKLYSQE